MSSQSYEPSNGSLEVMEKESRGQLRSEQSEEHDESEMQVEEKVQDEAYSAFSPARRFQILFLTTLSAFVSPTTANIILPALPNLARDLPASLEKVNLSVTVYLIFQGLTPIFVGSFTDVVGRRPIYLFCFLVYEGANAGLANLPNSYAGFLVLRMMQATGAASMVSIGAGCLADVVVPAQRGVWMGIFTAGATVGPSLGALIGAVLDQAWGWRSIFWFCFIIGGVTLLLVLFLLPETLRLLVGNGSMPAPTIIHEALLDLILGRTAAQKANLKRPGLPRSQDHQDDKTFSQRARGTMCNIFSPLLLLLIPETFLLLAVNAVPYTAFYCVSANLSNQFQQQYNLTTLQVGLVFLGPGLGCSVGSYVIGRFLDYDYRHYHLEGQRLPIERVRMMRYPLLLFGTVAPLIVYGWTVQYKVYIAVPIIMLFINGTCAGAIFSIVQVLLIDWHRGKSASITGCNNLTRCLSAAVGAAVINYVVDGIRPGWTFTLTALITAATAIPAWFIAYRSTSWIAARKRMAEDKLSQET